jgi:putative membrane protein
VYRQKWSLPADYPMVAPPMESRHARNEMTRSGLIHGQSRYPVSFTLITTVILLLIGVLAVVSMVFYVGPFEDVTGA